MANFYPDGAGPKDFFALVRLFGSNEHKEYVERLEKALDGLAETSKKQAEESRRLVELAVDLEAQRQAIEKADADLADYRQAYRSELATFQSVTETAREELAAERRAIVEKEGELQRLQERLKGQEAAIVEADRISQEAADQRAHALDQREAEIASGEAALKERLAKLAAALGS